MLEKFLTDYIGGNAESGLWEEKISSPIQKLVFAVQREMKKPDFSWGDATLGLVALEFLDACISAGVLRPVLFVQADNGIKDLPCLGAGYPAEMDNVKMVLWPEKPLNEAIPAHAMVGIRFNAEDTLGKLRFDFPRNAKEGE